MTLRRATERFREVGSLPVLLSALLIAAGGGDLSAQDRSRANDSSDRGGSRVAQPRDSGGSHRSSAPSSPPSSSSPSSPPRSASPSSPSSGGSSTSSSPSRPRYAQPGTSSGPSRQPPSRDRNDPDWRGGRGGHGGDWYGHGGYYYPRWYRYYGPGWWWAPYGYWGWWWLGDNYWPYDPYYGYPYDRGRGYYDRDEVGALDLDVSPGRTQVYLDGQYLGTVDQYDGFPAFLWLEKGTYDIAFYLEGYKTLARQVSVYPGTVIDMEDRLEPGDSVRPEDLVTKSHERRDDRLRYEQERRERIEDGDRYEDDDDEDEDWRDRVSRNREDRRDQGEEVEIEDEDAEDSGRSEQGRVRLEVEPEDASIYLDGQFVGTGEDLSNLRRGLLVVPGKHNVAVVRPGRESVEREFEVEAGEELELEIELEPTSR